MTYVKTVVLRTNRVHLEVQRGTHEQAVEYCQKEGDWEEHGVRPRPGRRTDLEELATSIQDGSSSVSEILMENPMAYHQYGRTLIALQDAANRSRRRDQMTQGYWFWGSTGTGKTSEVVRREGTDPDKVYWLPVEDKGWWDGYDGQEVVVIDDFRGQLPYSQLLRLCDWTPMMVSQRCKAPAPFLAKRLYVTAPQPPEDTYPNLSQRDSMDQLRRRFEIREFN